MGNINDIFMNNYDVTHEDAERMQEELSAQVMECVESGDIDDIEDIFYGYGLELDYIFDVIGY